MVRGSKPGGARFSARPDQPWGPPSLLYNGYRVFPGVKYGWGMLLTTDPFLVLWSWKSRAIPLPTLWATTGPVMGTLYSYLYSNGLCSITYKYVYYNLMVRGMGKLTYAKYNMNYKSSGGTDDGSTPSCEMSMCMYQTVYNRLCNSNVSDAYTGMN